MKKVLIVVAVLIAVIAIGTTVFLSNLDGLIKDTIEKEGTAALGTKVSVGSVETDLANGKAQIKGLSIANVAGYQSINALQIDTLFADVDYQNQLIEEVLIQQPIINAELKGKRSNFEDLLENMPAAEEDPMEEVDESDPANITIKKFSLNQATVNVLSDQLGQMSFVMDDLVISDLSGTPEEISNIVTTRLTNHIAKQVQAFATEQIKARLEAEVRARAEEKINEVVNEKVTDVVKDKVGDRLKDIKLKFGKD